MSELAEPFDMSQPAISKHLKVLERAGLITAGREAQRRPRRMEAAPLVEAAAWIERYRKIWEGNYRRLDALLEELQRTGAARSAVDRDTGARDERATSGSTRTRRESSKASKSPGKRKSTRRRGGEL